MLKSFSSACRMVCIIGTIVVSPACASKPDTVPTVGLAGHRFQQVALTVSDLPRAIAFYRDTLGLPLLFVANNMAFFDVAGTRLMIGLDPDRPSKRATSILYFDVSDFYAKVAKLNAAKVKLQGTIETVQRDTRGLAAKYHRRK